MYRQLTQLLVKPALKQYLKFDSTFHYKGLKLRIFRDVFHPRFFFSSKYLANFIDQLDLENKFFCEPCAGSGFISLIAYTKGASVCCFDISSKAVENIHYNFKKNFPLPDHRSFDVFQSDGFCNVSGRFDIIVINPPYFFKPARTPQESAWNCGENGDFFHLFFSSLNNHLKPKGKCYMVLAENCDIDRIKKIAGINNLNLWIVDEKKIAWERNFIFEIA